MKLVRGVIACELECVVGPKGKFRTTERFPDKDNLIATMLAEMDGKWIPIHDFHFKRER